jgi:hypothetical protein
MFLKSAHIVNFQRQYTIGNYLTGKKLKHSVIIQLLYQYQYITKMSLFKYNQESFLWDPSLRPEIKLIHPSFDSYNPIHKQAVIHNYMIDKQNKLMLENEKKKKEEEKRQKEEEEMELLENYKHQMLDELLQLYPVKLNKVVRVEKNTWFNTSDVNIIKKEKEPTIEDENYTDGYGKEDNIKDNCGYFEELKKNILEVRPGRYFILCKKFTLWNDSHIFELMLVDNYSEVYISPIYTTHDGQAFAGNSWKNMEYFKSLKTKVPNKFRLTNSLIDSLKMICNHFAIVIRTAYDISSIISPPFEKLGEEFQKIASVYYHASVNNLFKE